MKQTTEERPINSTLTGESTEFRIASNPIAFRILVDGLYSNKVESVMRELMSNADDAHRRNGNHDKPFIVRLPNKLNPMFSVRDFGCSMTHEQVMGEYSTLFASSKREGNDETGSFGLGAKAFLALTDSCTLRCWLNGRMRLYQIMLNERAIPIVTLVTDVDSSEPQGVEVNFAVDPSQFAAFATFFGKVALGYDTPPLVAGGEINIPKPFLTGNGWRLFNKGFGQDYIRQGSAIYPFYVTGTSLPFKYKMIFDVAIGEVNVTASRESLALTSDQNKAMQSRYQALEGEVVAMAMDMHHALPTAVERACFAHDHYDLIKDAIGTSSEYPTVVNVSAQMFSAAGDPLPSHVDVLTLRHMILVCDDGTKIVRRSRRLTALRGDGKQKDRPTLFIVNTEEDRDTVVRELDLPSKCVFNIADIPDVGPAKPRKPSKNNYQGTGPAQRKIIESARIWCERTGGVASTPSNSPFGSVAWRTEVNRRSWRSYLSVLGANSAATVDWINEVVKRAALANNPDAETEILYVTPLQIERGLNKGTLLPANRLDIMVAREIGKMSKTFGEIILRNTLPTTPMREALCPTGNKDDFFHALWMFEKIYPTQADAYRAEAKIKVKELKARYPLLWKVDMYTIASYIDMCDQAASDRQLKIA